MLFQVTVSTIDPSASEEVRVTFRTLGSFSIAPHADRNIRYRETK